MLLGHRISNMAGNLSRKCFVNSSIFAPFLRKKLPVSTSSPMCIQYPIQCRHIHASEIACGGRLKSEWRRKRAPALTRLCPDKPEKIKRRKAFGGGEKTKVTRANAGSYIWKSQDVQFRAPILDVLYNEAHKDFTERKIMVRGSVVEIVGEPFKTWYEDSSSSFSVANKEETKPQVDDRILEQLQRGKVLAKVSSRPGQEGKVNGYILEGEELDKYLEQTKAAVT